MGARTVWLVCWLRDCVEFAAVRAWLVLCDVTHCRYRMAYVKLSLMYDNENIQKSYRRLCVCSDS